MEADTHSEVGRVSTSAIGGGNRVVPDDWNLTEVAYPSAATIVELFELQAAGSSGAVAVVLGGESLTYGELNERSNRVAQALRKRGVRPGVLVGLCVERSFEMVVGVLGILKAGGAYVPLDAGYPKPRLEFMLEDTGAAVLVTTSGLVERLPETGTVLCLDRDWEEIAKEPAQNLPNEAGARDLAYVIYTSGSTGQPKGVCVEHRSIVRLVRGQSYTAFGREQRVLVMAPISFDASTYELWGPLLNGGCCVLYPERVPNADLLAELVERHAVTDVFLTTALFNAMVETRPEALRSLETVLTGGEAHSMRHIRRALEVLRDTRLVHVYGPTETTTFATAYEVPKDLAESVQSIPIGGPIGNTTCYVLDARGEPVAVGAVGELYIGGAGVARGYHARPELTAERFVADRFGGGDGRLYRTGDLVRWLANGTIDFLGREDAQVKIRGFRIELGEVEAALGEEPGVGTAVVTVRQGEAGDKRLVGYVVASSGTTLSESGLRESLRSRLPDYMVPTAFVVLEELPLTPNGKVDHEALPEPEWTSAAQYVAPRTPVEERLAAIFTELLGTERVGVHDDFFALGGHSLQAMQVVSRVRASLSTEFPMRAFFDAPTIAGAASRIATVADAGESMELLEL
jgi:amino acid adenylation domain-containing protein